MNGYHVEVDGRAVTPREEVTFAWVDRAAGIARLSDGVRSQLVVVEGTGAHWQVTLRGRRLSVTVRTRREQMLAEAEVAARAHGGPVDVRATLPGLVVALSVAEGDEVAEGDPLVTIEAMKMQNEVRAPKGGRVTTVAVRPGQPVATGALLLRIE